MKNLDLPPMFLFYLNIACIHNSIHIKAQNYDYYYYEYYYDYKNIKGEKKKLKIKLN